MKAIFKSKQQWDVRKVTEGGIVLGLVIVLNIVFSFYLTRVFPEGAAMNVSFIFVMALVYRYSIWYGAAINFLGTVIVYALLTPATMFPVIAIYSWWGIVISIALDYLGSSFSAIIIAYYLNESLFKTPDLTLAKGIVFIILRSIFGFLMGFVSGFLVWGNYAGVAGYAGPYLYSFVFNITLSGGQCGVAIILFIPLQKRLPQFFARKQLATLERDPETTADEQEKWK